MDWKRPATASSSCSTGRRHTHARRPRPRPACANRCRARRRPCGLTHPLSYHHHHHHHHHRHQIIVITTKSSSLHVEAAPTKGAVGGGGESTRPPLPSPHRVLGCCLHRFSSAAGPRAGSAHATEQCERCGDSRDAATAGSKFCRRGFACLVQRHTLSGVGNAYACICNGLQFLSRRCQHRLEHRKLYGAMSLPFLLWACCLYRWHADAFER